MTHQLRPDLYHSRPDWAEYSFHHSSQRVSAYRISNTTSLVKRVIFSNHKFPDMDINGVPVDRVAVVLNSNLGLKGINGQERSRVLSGSNLKQIIYCRTAEGKWEALNGIQTLEYPSDSTIFNVRLRIYDPSKRGFINAPIYPVKKWELDVNIV